MEWYAQIGWTAILSIFTLYYIASKFFIASDENTEVAAHVEPKDETNNGGTEVQGNLETEPVQHADSEKLFKCDVSAEQEELLKAIVSWKRKEDAGDKWQLTAVRNVNKLDDAVAVSCVLCAGDKCQMLKVVVLGDMSVIPKDQYKAPVSAEPKSGDAAATPISKVKPKGASVVPLWPDKKTPVRFGGYRKSNTITWKSPEKKNLNSSSRVAQKKSLTPKNDIPVGAVPIRSLAEYQDILTKAGSKYPVVIDFYADWCGPCKRMKPIFDQMAISFAGRAYFCKVNTDEVKAVANMLQIRSLPTFLVIKDGQTVEKILGANVEGLREGIMKHIMRTTGKSSKSKSRLANRSGSAYGVNTVDVNEEYLPCIATTQAIYVSKKNLMNIQEKILEFNQLMKSSASCMDVALLPTEIVELTDLVEILSAGNKWHANTLTVRQLDVVVHMLTKWPSHFCFPALDLCRIALLHPSIESYMLDQRTTTSSDSEQLTHCEKLCVAILQHAEREIQPTSTSGSELDSVADRNSILALKCCVNLFKYRTLWKLSLSNLESIIQICVSSNFQACGSSKKLLEVVSAVIYNTSMVAYAYPKECKDAIKSKIVLFASLLIALEINSKRGSDSSTVIRRLLQAIGTILYSCRQNPDFLSAETRQNLALTTASIVSYGVVNEIKALHKILELIPKTKKVLESFPNPWASD